VTDTFEEWLTKTQTQRDALVAYSKSEMPTDAVLVGPDLDKALRAELAAGLELVDCEYFLTGETARAILDHKKREDLDAYSANERSAMIKNEVKEIVRLRDSLELLKSIFSARRIAQFGARRNMEK
jgi:hypothetical protein